MKKIIVIFSCVFVCAGFSVQAQIETPVIINNTERAAYVFKDPRIDLLVAQQRFLNTLALRNVSGYRVQVLSTSDRSAANEARAKLMKLFPQYKTYLSYRSPYFRVRIGNFLDRDSASELQEELGKYFPNGVFTVKDRIDINPEVLLKEVKSKHGK